MANYLYKGDLPDNLKFSGSVAIDSETLGLNNQRDKLCLIQISGGDGNAHIVQLNRDNYKAPNLKKLLTNKKILKIFHFARFDMAVIKHYLGIDVEPVYCTKIASKLTRTYTDSHGLKSLCEEFLNKKISKHCQSSDWGAENLTKEQIQYAASDVLYLHAIKDKLDNMLKRENRTELAQECFLFLTTRVALDLVGWNDKDIFSHE